MVFLRRRFFSFLLILSATSIHFECIKTILLYAEIFSSVVCNELKTRNKQKMTRKKNFRQNICMCPISVGARKKREKKTKRTFQHWSNQFNQPRVTVKWCACSTIRQSESRNGCVNKIRATLFGGNDFNAILLIRLVIVLVKMSMKKFDRFDKFRMKLMFCLLLCQRPQRKKIDCRAFLTLFFLW